MKLRVVIIIVLAITALISCTSYRRSGDARLESMLDQSAYYYNRQAMTQADSGQYDQAISTINKAIMLRPFDPELYHNLGSIHYFAGNNDSAIHYYNRALVLRPGFSMAMVNLARIYLNEHNYQQAMDYTNMALEQNPELIDALVIKSDILIDNGLLDQADSLLQRCVQKHPKEAVYHQQLGYMYHKSGLLNDAINEYRISIGLLPHNPQLYYNLGNAFYQQCRLQEAAQAYQQALEMDPGLLESLNNYSMVLTHLGLYDEARQALLSAMEQDPDSPVILFNLSIIHERSQDYQQALTYVNKAIAYDSSKAIFYVHQGNLLQKTGEPKQAAIAYEHALALNEHSIAALNNFGSVLLQSDRVNEASLAFEKTISMYAGHSGEPDLNKMDESLAMVIGWCSAPERIYQEYAQLYNNLGKSKMLLGQPVAALAAYEQAIEIMPTQPETRQNLALALFALNETDRGKQELAMARILDGNAALYAGDAQQAATFYQDALSVDPVNVLAGMMLAITEQQLHGKSAQQAVAMAVASGADNVALLTAAGRYYHQQDQTQLADTLLQKALRLRPGSIPIIELLYQLHKAGNDTVQANHYLALLFEQNGNALAFANLYDAAMVQYEKSLQQDSTRVQPAFYLGELYVRKRLYEHSKKMFRHVLQLEPKHTGALLGLGTVFGNQGMYKAAITELQKLISLEPDNARAHYTLAVNYYFLKQMQASRYHVNKAHELGIEINPEFLSQLNE